MGYPIGLPSSLMWSHAGMTTLDPHMLHVFQSFGTSHHTCG